jgi:hypothetical protein
VPLLLPDHLVVVLVVHKVELVMTIVELVVLHVVRQQGDRL